MDVNSSKLNKNKRKIAFAIIIAVLTIINIIAGALIFLDIQVMKSPETTIKIDIQEINAEEALITTTLWIFNPNQFNLIIKNFEVVTSTADGDEVVRMRIDGGEIVPNGNRTFTSSAYIGFNGQSPELLTTTITGTVGMRFFGIIKKTMPIEINVITSIEDIIKDIALPKFHIAGDFGEITQEGVNFTAVIDIENPNSFDMNVEDFSVKIETDTGENVGNFDMEGGVVAAKSSIVLKGEGKILIEALNAEVLTINVSGGVGMKIVGINKSLSFSSEVQIKIPHLEDIFSMDSPTEALINADMKLTRWGFLNWGFTSYMILEMRNPNKIGLIARDIIFSIYRVDNEKETLIGDCTVNETEVGPENTTFIRAQIYLPIDSLLKGQRRFLPELPDGLLVVVRANVTIPGLDQAFWVGVSGYQDLHIYT